MFFMMTFHSPLCSGFGDVVDVRVTASTGAQVIEKGIKVSSGSIVTGTQQFSA
jgi:hypothetical protein